MEILLLSWDMKSAGVRNGGMEDLQLKIAQKCKSDYSLILSFSPPPRTPPVSSSSPLHLDKITPIAKS